MDKSFNDTIRKKFGFDAKHLTFSYNMWNMALWSEDQYPELAKNDSHLLDKLDKIFKEIANTDRKTAVEPLQIATQINGLEFSAKQNIPNILTNDGMTEMGKRATAQSSSTNLAHAIGTGTTTPTLADTLLQTEIFRKAIGTRTTIGQTERYGSAFTGSEVPSPPYNITEAGIFTVLTANTITMIARVTSIAFVLDVGKIFTIQSNITHKNGTQV